MGVVNFLQKLLKQTETKMVVRKTTLKILHITIVNLINT